MDIFGKKCKAGGPENGEKDKEVEGRKEREAK